ncbi:beta strand repeat-containing protein [Azospirillum sp. B510]|uniref:beta strand repeat-containing protein n=1 Tax=Azospirillum sp. (strain B510) TaxID=137722 RepID=UPI00031ABE68|nr:MBG domain-containing protein [Azospirillum sp. B510]
MPRCSGRSIAKLSLWLIASVALMESAIAPASAQTLPAGPSVAAGAVSIATPSGTSVIIDQTSRNAVINWNSFSIGSGNSVVINNGGGATLNRVTGNIPSRIDGSLTATGSVYLINPAGVAVGPGGKVLTGGSFTASTLDIPDAAFLNGGDKNFSGTSKATVTNAGSIGSLGGDVALIAREVTNTGTLTAPNGTVGLAAGYEVLVKDSAVEGGKFQVKVGGSDTAATTSGRIAAAAAEIRANGGNVYALAGNTGGVIAATGTASSGGRIFLTAGDGGTVEAGGTLAATRRTETGAVEGGDIRVSGGTATVTGTLSARGSAGKGKEGKGKDGKSAAGKGGTVAVTGTAVKVAGTATVDVSGSRGGAIAVGGDYQGGKDAARKTLKETVANAKTTAVAAGARLSADGTDGDGGSVVVWSDEHTDFAGAIKARGTGAGGKGGDAEVSGKATLSFRGTADLSAAEGAFGTLLLDPYNVTISAGSDSNVSDLSGVLTAGGNDSVLSVATLNGALTWANVAVSTGAGGSQDGTITVAAPVTWSTGAALTLAAAGDIVVNAPITATGNGAGLNLQYGVGRVYTIANNASVTMSGSSPTLRIGEAGTFQYYQTISSLADLASIDSSGATGRYALVKNLDAAGTTYTNALVSRSFSGTFAGLGNTISNLTVSAPGTDNVGLFATIGSSGTVRDLTLTGATLSGKSFVGGLVGSNAGTVTRTHVVGSVTGAGDKVGGLAGANTGAIGQSHATVVVTASGTNIGGLVGYNIGTVTQSYVTGSVTGGAGSTGGFVGFNHGGGSIADSYTTASVTQGSSVGGFAGANGGVATIARSYATGSIVGQGRNYTGGFVGARSGGTISSSYWDRGTTGQDASMFGTGLTTTDAFSSASYAGFDFTNTWYMVEGYTRPFLRSEYSTIIGNTHQLQLMGMAPSAAYTLATDIDARDTGASSAAGMWRISGNQSGFAPVGNSQQPFTGSLDGQGHVIRGLTFASTDGSAKLGLFGVVGTAGSIRDIGLTDVSITGSGAQAGSLASENSGTIVNAYATGTVTGGTGVGGLVGRNTGTITQSHAAVTVIGDSNVGGLVGESEAGTVNTVYATGAVHGTNSVGGLIGDSSADSVTKAYATGAVSGNATVGGLIGALRNGAGSLSESYATGAVTATDNKAGGLLGGVEDATVTNVYATGSVTGTIDNSDGEHFIGGLVGDNYYGTITNAYATGLVTLANTCTSGDCKAGGLAGRNAEGSINASYWDKGTTGQADAAGTGNGARNTVTGIETADAFSTATYGNFDLTNTWYLVDGQTRPFLRSEHATSIVNAHQLQLMALDPTAAYTLAADVDAGETGGGSAAGMWSIGGSKHGFVPVGNSSTPFTGSLDGQGHVIQRLAIRPEDYSGTNQGLFGVIGAAGNVHDVGLTDIAITGAGYTVGGLAGQNDGTITNAYVTGSVQGSALGGLVGKNTGTITRSYVTAMVSHPTVGGDEIGGLVSENTGTITQSYATGDVTGRGTVGGFAAKNSGTITQSYATGALTGTIGTDFGGFVGNNTGSISQSYATGGAVSANMSVGGFVGMNTGAISQSYAAKSVSGSSMVGGFFGFYAGGTITSSYFDTTVAGTTEHAGSASTVAGMTGLTTAQFQDTASFMTGASGWDFDSVWVPPSSGYYPVLYAMAPVTWVKALSADTVYSSGSGTVTAIGTQSSLSNYIFGKAGDSLTLTGATIATDPTAAVSATPTTASQPASNATVTSAKGTDYRVFYYGSAALTVTPAALTITAGNATKTYGDTATLSGYTVTGLKNSDSVTGVTLSSTGTAATAGVGSYSISGSSAQGTGLSNYTVSYTDGTLTVNPATLTIAADDVTKTYGDTATLTGFTATGLKNSDRVTGVSLSSTGGTAVTDGVGSYAITASSARGTGLSNYTVSYTGGTLTVNPATLTIAADGVTKTYGDTASVSGYAVTGLKDSDRVTGVSLSSTGGTAATDGVGSYAITASAAQGSGLSNYTITYADGTLTVNPATLTVTADAVRKTYGDSTTLTGFTATGLKNSDSVTGVNLSSSGTAATAGVGSYSIAAASAQGSGLSNYTITYANGTLTVDPAALTVTADAARKTYGDSATLTGFTATGLKNSDSVTGVSLSSSGTAATAGVGSYSIAAASAQGSGLSNYTITYANGTLTVDPAALTVTADAARKTYGDSATLTGFTATGLKNSDSVTGVSLSSSGTAATAGVGSYSIAAAAAQGSGLSNYTVTYADGTLTVNPAALTVTADAARKTYGDSATLTGFTATGLKNSDSVTGVSLSSSGTVATAGVGSYAITASAAQGSGLSNYTVTYANGTLTVDPAALTVTADAARKTYGDSATLTGFTATGLKNSDSVTGVNLSSSGTAATAGVGSYAITASAAQGSGLSNYTVTYANGTLTVDPAALTVTADAARKTYGDSATLTGFTATGLKNSDSVTGVSLSSSGTAATAGVGSYAITASAAQGSGLSNYTITYADGTLTVNPAALTVTADAARKTYGDSATLTGFTATGLKNSDSVTGVSLSSSGTAATAGVGSYAITASAAQGSGLSNYTITYADGTLTVNPAALTVTADAARKTYGDSATLTGFTATGLKNSDSVTGVSLSSSGTVATAGVGSYAITASAAQGSGLSNYTITYVDGALTVTPRSILVTADSLSRPIGTGNPALTYTVGGQGLANGDTLDGTLSTAAGTASPAGSYTIEQGMLAASANYGLTFLPGVLTVTATGETMTPQPPSGPVQVEELTQVLAVAALPRNLVVVTASPTTQPFRNDDAPVSFPTAGPQAASGDARAAVDGASGGSSGGSGSQETAGGAAACIGGAAASGDCTAAPHPENTLFGRFLRFSMP